MIMLKTFSIHERREGKGKRKKREVARGKCEGKKIQIKQTREAAVPR